MTDSDKGSPLSLEHIDDVSQQGQYWDASPEDAPIDVIHRWAEEHPEVTYYMDTILFNDAQNAIRELGRIIKILRDTPSLLSRLSDYEYLEAIELKHSLLAGLGNLATALDDALSHPVEAVEITEPDTRLDKQSAMAIAELGLYIDPRHPISRI